jgi:transcription-repair coupling factor (superfamily II helicase)
MAKPASLIEALASAAPFEQILRPRPAKKQARPPLVLENVLAEAHPHILSVLALSRPGRTWVVCDNPRAQERLFSVLQQWLPTAVFFPDAPEALMEGVIADPSVGAERLSVLEALRAAAGQAQCVFLTATSLESRVPSPEGLQASGLHLRRGQRVDRSEIVAGLERQGYELVPQVSERGQLSVRGGIVDLFGFQHLRPVRVELFGDEIESIRAFDLDAQTSVEVLEECTVLSLDAGEAGMVPLVDLIGPGDCLVFSDAFSSQSKVGEEAETAAAGPIERWLEKGKLPGGECFAVLTGGAPQKRGRLESDATACFETGLGPFNAGDFIVDAHKREQFSKQLKEWREQDWNVFLFCRSEGEQERLQEMLAAVEVDAIRWCLGEVPGGFVCPGAAVAVLCDGDLLGRSARHLRGRRRAVGEVLRRPMPDFSDLEEGELVVHLDHGIARFEELREIPREGTPEQVLVLSFANNAKMYVPLEQSGLVSRYIGIGKRNPPLSELGDGKWARARKGAEQAVYQYAGRLLALHAERELSVREAHAPDNRWVQEFESAFPYEETADQVSAINAAKIDMESPRPMDRLICGDVGFGKTEVAIRAAFKAVMGGRQVALLVPTTVLAEQHYRNFRERMSAFPVRVDMLSRFRSPAEQRNTVEGLRDGSVDIVVGTHRILSTKLEFKNLGLVVIDEEQRFGVLHKERLKERFRLVDQLTLSATPIPRTLYLSLMGAKDMSTLETPPANRIPVETFVCAYDERIIRDAIQREVGRGGQVYFLHNRIESIHRVKDRLQKLLPKVRFVVGHGRMDEDELEEVMQAFLEGRADVLISTTIIESGLDIPNANTILIDRADRFGLADLYQLRGRVGRSDRQAYAYLLLPRALLSTGEARKRINAIKQYSSLGAGFKIALRDLEIRGAGNILGTQQSGHICAIGFELYCSLLKQAMATHKGEATLNPQQAASHLDFVASREPDFLAAASGTKAPAFLPTSFLEDAGTRIAAYRALVGAKDEAALEALAASWRDRFGARLPQAVENLLSVHAIRIVAGEREITKLEVKEDKVMLSRKGDYVLIGNKFPRLSPRLDPSARLRELLGLIRKL